MTLIPQYLLSSYLTLSIKSTFKKDLESITVTDNNCFGPLILDLIPETKKILLIIVLFQGNKPITPFLKDFLSVSK